MSHDLQVVVKRLSAQMVSIRDSQVPGNTAGLEIFMGMGLALTLCFEIATGQSFRAKKPQEILQWAIDLPNPERRII